MKTFFTSTVIILVILSCNKIKDSSEGHIIPENKKSESVTADLTISDSLKIEDSINIHKKVSVFYSAKALVFPEIKDKALLDSIYSSMGVHLDAYSKESLMKELQNQKKNYFEQCRKDANEFMPDFEQTWESTSDMNIQSNKNQLLTVTYEVSGYSGGAHGYYNIMFKNFDLKQNKTLELKDIFQDPKKINWNKLLSSHFDNDDQKEMLLVDKIPVNNNFYFDQDGITFVYNQYEITAYAAGVVEINIPYIDVKAYVKPEFLQRFGIK